MRSTSPVNASSSASVPVVMDGEAECVARWRPSATVNVRSANALTSVGLSIRYCRFGAVKVNGVVAGEQLRRHAPGRSRPARSKRTVAGRISKPRAHISAAGMLMCAWVAVDAEVGAVHAIAEDAIGHAHGHPCDL